MKRLAGRGGGGGDRAELAERLAVAGGGAGVTRSGPELAPPTRVAVVAELAALDVA